jgi:ribose transport system ATP-binding protein
VYLFYRLLISLNGFQYTHLIETNYSEKSFDLVKPILQLQKITKQFPGVLALDEFSFDIYPGEIHALLGENGAGKSTLMKIISGVYHKDSGKILFHDKTVDIKDPLSAQQQGITIIHQELNLFPELTVAQNIYIGREPRSRIRGVLDEKQLNKDAKVILQSLKLNIIPTEKVVNLTVAKQQMVEIAKALSFKAEVLIMDEPTSALTESEIVQLFKIIKDLRNSGVAIVYISHRLAELEELADRVTVMRDGRWVNTLMYEQTSNSELISLMVGRDIDNMFHKSEPNIGGVLLEVKGLNRKGYLKDINMQVRKGEILGVAGLMGAGRSELGKAIFGADKISSGNILFEGKEVSIKSPIDAISLGIGYLTEDRKKDGLVLNSSVEHNTVLASIEKLINSVGIVNCRLCQKITKEQVENLKIKTPSLEQKVINLSGGNQQKVIIAKWLCRESKLLIFDEPTRGIDVGAKVEVYDLMSQLSMKGVAIIMISSELPEILSMSDRILVMHEGRITGELISKDATQEKIMSYATGNH